MIFKDTATLYKSALLPLGLEVLVQKQEEEKPFIYKIIFKKVKN